MVESELMRVDKEFKKAVDKIRIERVKNGRDDRTQSSPRITKAMTRQADFNDRMKEIINADFKEE